MTNLSDLIFYRTGATSFHDKAIPDDILKEILTAATTGAWIGRWKLLSVTERDVRLKVVEAWQEALKGAGRPKDAEFIERWKDAPLFIAFVQPKDFQPFQWVPGEYARIYGIQEVGAAVRSMELKALEHGIALHGIMGLLVPEIGWGVKGILGISDNQELVFFGIIGYPNEVVEQKFPALDEVRYKHHA